MKWIDIKEQLPPHAIGILITDGKIVTCAKAQIKNNEVFWFSGHEFLGYDWEWDFELKDITHWAELPEPPQFSGI